MANEFGTYVPICNPVTPALWEPCQCAYGDGLTEVTCICVNKDSGAPYENGLSAVIDTSGTSEYSHYSHYSEWCEENCQNSYYPGLKLDADPGCADGILSDSGLACCPVSCGRCGGPGCSDLPGGSYSCCASSVILSTVSCNDQKAPCTITPASTDDDDDCDGVDLASANCDTARRKRAVLAAEKKDCGGEDCATQGSASEQTFVGDLMQWTVLNDLIYSLNVLIWMAIVMTVVAVTAFLYRKAKACQIDHILARYKSAHHDAVKSDSAGGILSQYKSGHNADASDNDCV